MLIKVNGRPFEAFVHFYFYLCNNLEHIAFYNYKQLEILLTMKENYKKHALLTAGLAFCALGVSAQQIRSGYVTLGDNTGSSQFHTLLNTWTPGTKVSEDDNFFISRVKPHTRFRNQATQVRTDITADNDKKLVAWVPVNSTEYNALPDGVFDSEVFSMWSYVTHWGDWTAPLGRIPAAFLDVAHKNGVPVSGVASIPNTTLSGDWLTMVQGMGSVDVDNAAKFFRYYGIDGLGYNSEFYSNTSVVTKLRTFHINLNKKMKETNPLFENIWYDGTNDYGQITFDRGLASHNAKTFGDADNVCYSLFLNYNWNSSTLLSSSVTKAKSLKRSPLDLYAGVNMQGGKPSYNSWTLLKNYPISIGLWGAHSYNMFWESRGELGSDPAVKQNAYMMRTERYFTGGTRNPANCPAVTDAQAYNAYNLTWHGMSSFMSARSALLWDLGEEPFITHFNLGNGKFFNLNGVRQHDKSWYNIGVQDYLPTWRWWFASKLLGRTAADVPATGLDANFTWDDAYFGGSTVRISGSTADEYLHLFKTQYSLQKGDVITFKYKLAAGAADMELLLSAVGSEDNATAYTLCRQAQEADDEQWVTCTFTVGTDFDGKDLALVALHFQNAQNLDLLLGEFSIIRGTYATPSQPRIESAKLLYNCKDGMDGKVIFNMANGKAAGEPCYNLDVNTSHFRLYAQQEGQEKVLMGTTTSWAALYYSIPVPGNVNGRMRLGVSAVSLDEKSESAIAWSDYMTPATYFYNDDIQIDKNVIKPGENFTISYVDDEHPAAEWQLADASGNILRSGSGNSWSVEGLAAIGSYDLIVTGNQNQYDSDGNFTGTATTTRRLNSFVQVSGEEVGAVPEIYTLTANGKDGNVTVDVAEKVAMAYTGRNADGLSSQGIDLKEKHFGVKCSDIDAVGAKSFSLSFWLKLNKLAEGVTQFISVASQPDGWPKSEWGWLWTTFTPEGNIETFTFRGIDGGPELQYNLEDANLPVGSWVHLATVFDYNASGNFRSEVYVNGKKLNVLSTNRSTTPDDSYQSGIYKITSGMLLAIGGDAFGRNGIDGVVDNVAVWNKAMTADEVALSMGDLDKNNLPAGVAAFWDFEEASGTAKAFKAVGAKAGIEGGVYDDQPNTTTVTWLDPEYSSGCPFLKGSAYKVQTLPTWKASHGRVTDATGNGEAGSANVAYAKGGDYTVTLTLANSIASVQRTFSVIKVLAAGIGTAEAAEVKTYTVGEDAVVEFAEAGNYEVGVYDAAGVVQARKAATLNAGNVMTVHLANPGVYVLTVKKDGKPLRTVKLVRK